MTTGGRLQHLPSNCAICNLRLRLRFPRSYYAVDEGLYL